MILVQIREGKWREMSQDTLDELTRESMRAGNFSLRILVAEVWRLRHEVRRLQGASQ